MKKAWPHIKCVLFIVVLAVVILVCDYLFAESGYIRFVLNDVNSSNESYDTIVLGASHTRCSIDTEYLDKYMNVNSFNMGIPGETVDDFYYVLKSVVDSGNCGCRLLLLDEWAVPESFFQVIYIPADERYLG